MTRLQHVLERARAAVRARAGLTPCPDRAGGFVQYPEYIVFVDDFDKCSQVEFSDTNPSHYESLPQKYTPRTVFDPVPGSGVFLQRSAYRQPTVRPVELPAPVVLVSAPTEPAEGPSWASCAAAEVLAGLRVSPGAQRVFLVLHRLALDVAWERAYRLLPDSVAFHVPALMVAGLTGYTDRHLRRLVGELEGAGLIDAGGHASRVGLRSLYDGTLWAVKVKPGDVVPQLRPDDWRHNWRPTFAADVEGKRGAARVMSELKTTEADEGEIYRAVLRAAVAPDAAFTPVASSSDMAGAEAQPRTVREVVYRLGELAHAHPTRRPELVGRLASALAHTLGDEHSRRWYCRLLWDAWTGHTEGRGTLQALAAALSRLDTDRREWEGLRNPGAVLAARLRVA